MDANFVDWSYREDSFNSLSSEEESVESVAPATLLFPKDTEESKQSKGRTKSKETEKIRRRTNPKRSNVRLGLSDTVQKALLVAFEAGGGFKEFFANDHQALHKLCETDVVLFGKADSNQREQIRNKVRHWKDLESKTPAEYLKLLLQYQIFPFSQEGSGSPTQVPPPTRKKRPSLKVTTGEAPLKRSSPSPSSANRSSQAQAPTPITPNMSRKLTNKVFAPATSICLPVQPDQFDRSLASKYNMRIKLQACNFLR
jgi:hypothetical protein